MIKIKASLPILFCIFGFFSSAKALEKPSIISGFDDVLRQAENTGLIKAALKIFEDDKTFTGMCELYTAISSTEQNPRFSLVSAISHFFDARIHKLLIQHHCPSHRLYLRNWLTQWSIQEFKMNSLKEIIQAHPDRKWIVIFDNSEASIHLSDKIQKEFSGQVVAIYLRQVIEKPTPASALAFYTAFDIAMNEYMNGRMSAAEVNNLAQVTLSENERGNLFPSYAVCHGLAQTCPVGDKEIIDSCLKVDEHLQKLCSLSPK